MPTNNNIYLYLHYKTVCEALSPQHLFVNLHCFKRVRQMTRSYLLIVLFFPLNPHRERQRGQTFAVHETQISTYIKSQVSRVYIHKITLLEIHLVWSTLSGAWTESCKGSLTSRSPPVEYVLVQLTQQLLSVTKVPAFKMSFLLF